MDFHTHPCSVLAGGELALERAVFEMKRTAVGGYFFVFRDLDGQGIVVSKSFQDRSSLEICVAHVRDNAKVASVVEMMDDSDRSSMLKYPPLFLLETGKTGCSFSLIDFDGAVVFSSKRYVQKDECLKSIEKMKNLSLDAGVVDSVNV